MVIHQKNIWPTQFNYNAIAYLITKTLYFKWFIFIVNLSLCIATIIIIIIIGIIIIKQPSIETTSHEIIQNILTI